MIDKRDLEELYLKNKLSMMDISKKLNCSEHKVEYWMKAHNMNRRSRSEATYIKQHPNGDNFKVKLPKSKDDFFLYGLGIGLYWGEGNRAGKWSVRLGNTDPALLRAFMQFLEQLFGVKKEDLRFGLHIFTDIDQQQALNYWIRELGVSRSQFYKPTVTISGKIGTYKKKSLYGVVQVEFHNIKLRNIIVELCRDSSVARARQW